MTIVMNVLDLSSFHKHFSPEEVFWFGCQCFIINQGCKINGYDCHYPLGADCFTLYFIPADTRRDKIFHLGHELLKYSQSENAVNAKTSAFWGRNTYALQLSLIGEWAVTLLNKNYTLKKNIGKHFSMSLSREVTSYDSHSLKFNLA